MGDAGEYWKDHRDHERDVKAGRVRCSECGAIAEPSKKSPRLSWCTKCRRLFKTPEYALQRTEES